MVVDAQAASRERTPRRARVDLEELTMRRRIKKDVVHEVFSDASCSVNSLNKKIFDQRSE